MMKFENDWFYLFLWNENYDGIIDFFIIFEFMEMIKFDGDGIIDFIMMEFLSL